MSGAPKPALGTPAHTTPPDFLWGRPQAVVLAPLGGGGKVLADSCLSWVSFIPSHLQFFLPSPPCLPWTQDHSVGALPLSPTADVSPRASISVSPWVLLSPAHCLLLSASYFIFMSLGLSLLPLTPVSLSQPLPSFLSACVLTPVPHLFIIPSVYLWNSVNTSCIHS